MAKTLMNNAFSEVVALIDDTTWIWQFVTTTLSQRSLKHVRLPSNLPIKQNWGRLKGAEFIIIHWENKLRTGGATIEEILEVDPTYDVASRIILLTTDPTHQDVVYFSEIGLSRILRMRNRETELVTSRRDLENIINGGARESKLELSWRQIQAKLDANIKNQNAAEIEKIEAMIGVIVKNIPNEKLTARYLDAEACLLLIAGKYDEAEAVWMDAMGKNPNFNRIYKNITVCYIRQGKLEKAMALMEKLSGLNNNNISRLVLMGELKMQQNDVAKAEHYFNSALLRDSYCSRAMNGLAEIKFLQGNLDESRKLLSRSFLATEVASKLNNIGIQLVKKAKYEEALKHYTKAQYILPQQDKGPMLFYNIALCYFKWGKINLAKEFCELALTKEPTYTKASKLLEYINAGGTNTRNIA